MKKTDKFIFITAAEVGPHITAPTPHTVPHTVPHITPHAIIPDLDLPLSESVKKLTPKAPHEVNLSSPEFLESGEPIGRRPTISPIEDPTVKKLTKEHGRRTGNHPPKISIDNIGHFLDRKGNLIPELTEDWFAENPNFVDRIMGRNTLDITNEHGEPMSFNDLRKLKSEWLDKQKRAKKSNRSLNYMGNFERTTGMSKTLASIGLGLASIVGIVLYNFFSGKKPNASSNEGKEVLSNIEGLETAASPWKSEVLSNIESLKSALSNVQDIDDDESDIIDQYIEKLDILASDINSSILGGEFRLEADHKSMIKEVQSIEIKTAAILPNLFKLTQFASELNDNNLKNASIKLENSLRKFGAELQYAREAIKTFKGK